MAPVLLAVERLAVLAELAVIQLQCLVVASGDTKLAGVIKVKGGDLGAFGEVGESLGRPEAVNCFLKLDDFQVPGGGCGIGGHVAVCSVN